MHLSCHDSYECIGQVTQVDKNQHHSLEKEKACFQDKP